MSNKTTELGSAFQSLNVGSTLRNQKATKELKAPQFEAPRMEGPLSKTTLNEESQTEVPQTKYTQIKIPQNEIAQVEKSHIERPQLEEPRSVHTQDMSAISKATHHELPQIVETPIEDDHHEVPESELSHFEGSQLKKPHLDIAIEGADHNLGYFKLSHAVFSDRKLQKLSGDTFRLFLWMSSRAWRYKTSKGLLRASVRWITDSTGMSHATVSRGLKALRECDLVKLVEPDYHDGNLWKVSPKALSNPDPQQQPPSPGRKESAQIEPTQKDIPVDSKSESSSLKLNQQLPQNVGNIRSIKNIKNETLSSEPSEFLERYFSEIKPYGKREGEWDAFQGLLKDYSRQDIADCVKYLQKNGALKSQQPCHSPMAYLALAMSEVLPKVVQSRRNPVCSTAKARTEQVKEKMDEDDAELLKKAEAAFRVNIPLEGDRQRHIDAYIAKNLSAFPIPKNVARNLAIMTWYEGVRDRGQGLRNEATEPSRVSAVC